MKSRILIQLMALVLLPCASLFSQPDDVISMDSTYCDFIHSQNVELLPPLKADMPFDVMVGYMVADTLCRLYDGFQIDSILQDLSDDSLIIAVKTFIAMRNYDTFLYEILCKQLFFNPPAYYKTYYRVLEEKLMANYYERVKEPTLYDTLRDKYRGGIYQVRVTGQSMYLDSIRTRATRSSVAEVFCADLEVVASVFCYGTHFMCGSPSPEDDRECIRVSWYRSEPESYIGYDSTQIYNMGPGYLDVGSEYLVFLTTWNSAEGDWQYHPLRVYEIVNGTIHDPDQFFRKGEYVNAVDLLMEMHEEINLIQQ